MALSVLLVDPDENWLGATGDLFKKQLYKVDMVSNGKDAQLKLYNNKYFAVVMNYAIQNHSAYQVFTFIKRGIDYKPRVLIYFEREDLGDESELLQVKLQKEGVDEILIKPFETSTLLSVLEGHQGISDIVNNLNKNVGQSEEEEVSMGDENFTAIKIVEFYALKNILFDTYIKLNSGRYLKFFHAGDEFSKERLDRYKNEKGVEHLYFHVKDRKKYIKFNNYLAGKMIKNEKLDNKNKINMLKNVTEKFMEEAFNEGVKPVILEQGREICESVYALIEKNPDLHTQLREFQDFDPSAFSHAYLTTLYTAAIIKQFEWQSKTIVECAALASMFHDIGKIKLDKSLLNVRPKDMGPEQLEEYEKHPMYGIECIQNNKTITQPVRQIILQHHEAFDGTGFPNQVKGQNILTLSNIVGLADNFSHIIVDENVRPVDALKLLLKDEEACKKYNSMILERFIQVFADPNKIKKQHLLPGKSRLVPNKKAS